MKLGEITGYPLAIGLATGLWSELLALSGKPAASRILSDTLLAAGVTAAYITAAGLLVLMIAKLAMPRSSPFPEALTFAGTIGLAAYTLSYPALGAFPVPIPWRLSEAGIVLLSVSAFAGLAAGAALTASRLLPSARRWASAAAIAVVGGFFAADVLYCVAANWIGDSACGWAALIMAAVGGLALQRMPADALQQGSAGLQYSLAGLLAAVAAVHVWWPAPAPQGALASAPPIKHIVLITVDTLRADSAMSAAGPRQRFGSLTEDSVVFERAYSAGPWTPPGLTSILTGVSSGVHRAENNGAPPLDKAIRTLGDYARDAGYLTAAIGENPNIQGLELDRGFDWSHTSPSRRAGRSFGWRILQKIDPRYMAYPRPERLTSRALDWIAKNESSPFFLWIHYLDPHDPYEPPARFLPCAAMDPLIGNSVSLTEHLGYFERKYYSPEALAAIRCLYELEVDWVDEQVGRLLKGLRDRGLYDDSLIVFTSDHGEAFWEHGQSGHGKSLHEEVVHVPLMLKLPQQSHRSHISEPVSNVGVAATILDLAEIQQDTSLLSVQSLARFWTGPAFSPESPPPPVFFALNRRHDQSVGAVWGENKFVKYLATGMENGVNLADDPMELTSTLSPEDVEAGRALVAYYLKSAEESRSRLGLRSEADDDVELDDAALEHLRGLGYIQ